MPSYSKISFRACTLSLYPRFIDHLLFFLLLLLLLFLLFTIFTPPNLSVFHYNINDGSKWITLHIRGHRNDLENLFSFILCGVNIFIFYDYEHILNNVSHIIRPKDSSRLFKLSIMAIHRIQPYIPAFQESSKIKQNLSEVVKTPKAFPFSFKVFSVPATTYLRFSCPFRSISFPSFSLRII